ncbi:MAG: hypothetical protein ABL953_07355 [Ilumatobacteraceae bacterium]
MNTTTRNLVLIGTTVATVAVGVFATRAMDEQESPAALGDHDAPVLVGGDIETADDLATPIVEPVAISHDPAMLEHLLEGPPAITDDTPGPEIGRGGGGSGVTGGVVGPVISEDAFDGLEPEDPAPAPDPRLFPIGFDPTLGLVSLPELAFDACAGVEPGTPPSSSCPEGYGGTLFADHIAPEPFLFGNVGHYLTDPTGAGFATCPADTPAAGAGQTAITIFSQTPLDSLTVEWRPYGSSHAWQTLVVDPATPADERAAWFARFESEPFDREAFYLSRCVVIDRDPNIAYEVRLFGIDAFLRVVNGNGLMTLPDATPQGRPPTSANIIGVQPFAEVTAWTKPEGSVSFSTRIVTDLEGSGDCTDYRTEAIPTERVHVVDGQHASPVGVYDPAFTRKVVTSVPLPPAGLVLLCATIYDTGNTLRPLGTDSVLLHAPTAQRPLITLEGFRLNSGVRVSQGSLAALIQFPGERELVGDGCGQVWANSFQELVGSVAIGEPLWTCDEAPLPVDSTGYVKVPVTIARFVIAGGDREWRSESWGIQIQVDRCDPTCPPRPTEWFEIPVPTASGVLCGRNFWESDEGCPQPTDGVAIIKVEYPVIDAAPGAFGTATLIASSDRPVADPTAGEPIVYQDSTVVTAGPDWSALPTTMTIFSDRAVTINSVHMVDVLGDAGPGCNERTVAVGGAPATEFHVAFTLCAGTYLSATANVTDAAGVVYEKFLGLAFGTPDVVATSVHTRVEFLGGDVPQFGWIYRFAIELDGQTPTYYGWYDWAGTLGPDGPSCLSLDNAVADGPHGPRIRISGGSLEVTVLVHISAGGARDCGRGTGGTYSGITEFSGSFTMAQISSGMPLTLTTPADADLQLRLTVDADWRLAPTS